MHDLGSWGSGTAGTLDAWDGPRFLGGSLLLTLALLAAGLLWLRVLDLAWFGVLLVFCAVTFAYLMPFLWNSLFRVPRSAKQRG